MGPSDTSEIIRSTLAGSLHPTHLEVTDESHRHAGHASSRSGGGHYAVTIVSSAFEGLGPLERHRLVYKALSGAFGSRIHALSLRALTPAEHAAAPGA